MYLNILWFSLLGRGQHECAGHQQVDQGQRQAELPAEGHDLVIPWPRNRGAQQDEDHDEEAGFQGKPEKRNLRQYAKWPVPTAEEQGYQQRRDGDDADVFTDEEHAPFHPGIFDVVTVGQLLLSFRLVEGVTVSHRHAGDKEGTEAEELRNDEPEVFRLVIDNVAHVERANQ